MNTKQRKNVIQFSSLITDMNRMGATEREIDRVVLYLEGVLNNELEFDDIHFLGGISDIINKYIPE